MESVSAVSSLTPSLNLRGRGGELLSSIDAHGNWSNLLWLPQVGESVCKGLIFIKAAEIWCGCHNKGTASMRSIPPKGLATSLQDQDLERPGSRHDTAHGEESQDKAP